MQCSICKLRPLATEDEIAMQACAVCARDIGVIPMPPSTRPPTPCSCGSRKFLRSFPREHAPGTSMPMILTHRPESYASGLISGAAPIDITRGWGLLEVYACFGCGKVEWFCGNVASIPIHPHLMTQVVDYDSGEPYR